MAPIFAFWGTCKRGAATANGRRPAAVGVGVSSYGGTGAAYGAGAWRGHGRNGDLWRNSVMR